MILERISSSSFEEVGKVFKMTKCGIYRWECVAGMGERPHTPCFGVFGPILLDMHHVIPFLGSYLNCIRFRTLH